MEYTIIINYISYLKSYEELTNYLLSIKGINDVKINELDDLLKINVKYNKDLINDERIRLEILAFLNLLNWPSIYGYDKHPTKKDVINKTYKFNLCCEFCFGNIIYYLCDINGIEKVESDFYQEYWHGNDKNHEYTITIYYNPSIIDDKKLKEIEEEINIYG